LTLPAERRASVLYAGLLAAVMVALLAAQLRAQEYTQFFIDFKVPYCAAQAMLHGADPYRFGALPACEHALAVGPFVPALGAHDPALPLPIPPYELLPFLVLAPLPFAVALAVWMGLNIGSCAVAADLLRRALPHVHPALIGAAVIVSAVPVGLDLGQFTGLELLAVTGLGLALRDRTPFALGGWCALATLQPHVALPGAFAILVAGERRAKLAVICVGVVLAGVSAFAFGRLSLEWLTMVLPGHAGVNLIDVGQVSFISAAATLGAPFVVASPLSKMIYIAAIGLGAFFGARIARATGRPEALPWIATAVGTLGAPYLHQQQLTFVLPAALLLIEIGPARSFAQIALFGLAIPWMALVTQSWGPLFAIVAATGTWRTPPTPRRLFVVAGTALLLLTILIAAAYGFNELRRPEAAFTPPVLAPDAFAEDAWAPFIALKAQAYGIATLPARALTWAAGLLLIVLAGIAAFGARVTLKPGEPVIGR